MSDNKDTKTHTFELGGTRVTLSSTKDSPWRDQQVVVVYMGSVGPSGAQHIAPIGGVPTLDMEPIMIESGGSFVGAGLLADHIDHERSILRRYIERGELRVYATPEAALDGSLKEVSSVVAVSRDAALLNTWLKIEEDRPTKRGALIRMLKERIRIHGDHSTPRPTLVHMRQAQEAVAAARATG